MPRTGGAIICRPSGPGSGGWKPGSSSTESTAVHPVQTATMHAMRIVVLSRVDAAVEAGERVIEHHEEAHLVVRALAVDDGAGAVVAVVARRAQRVVRTDRRCDRIHRLIAERPRIDRVELVGCGAGGAARDLELR